MQIGSIANQFGHLQTKEEDGKYYWSIEDICPIEWEEIPVTLYVELLKFEAKRWELLATEMKQKTKRRT